MVPLLQTLTGFTFFLTFVTATMTISPEQEWVDRWKKLGPILEQLRCEDLRTLTDAEGTRRATFLGIPKPIVPRPASGLIEYQRWLRQSNEGAP